MQASLRIELYFVEHEHISISIASSVDSGFYRGRVLSQLTGLFFML